VTKVTWLSLPDGWSKDDDKSGDQELGGGGSSPLAEMVVSHLANDSFKETSLKLCLYQKLVVNIAAALVIIYPY